MLTPSALDAAAAGTGLTTVYQPIVALPGSAVVGYEALARWPQLNIDRPELVFTHASATGVIDNLDRLCMEAALRGARHADLSAEGVLLINSEPASSYVPDDADLAVAAGEHRFHIIVELTERDLLARPGALLKKVAALRNRGCGIALDDVGAHPDSMALLDVVSPDLVKLDMTFVQSVLHPESVRTLSGLLAYRERTGALLLAEGIESGVHYHQALAMGASFGQGFHLGEPGAVDATTATGRYPLPGPQTTPPTVTVGSVFDTIAADAPHFTVDAHTAMELSRELARKAEGTYQPLVLIAAERFGRFTDDLTERYRKLTAEAPLVAVFGNRLPTSLDAGIRRITIPPNDPLTGEWLLLILSTDVAAALALRQHQPDAEVQLDTRFDLTITHDRGLVARVARDMLSRMP